MATPSPVADASPHLVKQAAQVLPEALARSLYGKLRAEGLTERDMMALVGELLGLVTAEMRDKSTDG